MSRGTQGASAKFQWFISKLRDEYIDVYYYFLYLFVYLNYSILEHSEEESLLCG